MTAEVNGRNSFCLTINNYTEKDEELLKSDNFSYLVYGYEIGESGTPHLQIYIEYKSTKLIKTIKNRYKTAHIEERNGTAKQASDYCKKDNKFIELGEISKQGKRTDINKLRDMLVSNETTVEKIAIENPIMYHNYGRTLSKIEDIVLRKKWRTWMTTCDWHYGETGTGKSHSVLINYNPETHYIYPNDGGWWDEYIGQEIVVINEFRGEIMYKELLELIDKWPKSVRRRNRVPVPFLAKHIVITSSMTPNEVYHNLSQNDKLEQLYRRIVLKYFDKKFNSEEDL